MLNVILKSYIREFYVISLSLVLALSSPLLYGAGITTQGREFNIPQSNGDTYSASAFPDNTIVIADSILKLQLKIKSLTAKVQEQNNLITNLDPEYQVKYPLGIVKNIGGLTYIIVLESDEITPQGAFVNAYMNFETPQGKSLCFAADKIPLSATGGINGVVELRLINDEYIEFGDTRFWIYGDTKGVPRTKVRFDCSGFIDLTLDAGIEFSKDVFVPENPETGEQMVNQSLSAGFIATLQSWNDLIIDINLPPFQIKSIKGIGMEVSHATFDFSDLNNPAGIVFPEDYHGLLAYGNFPQLWQGFYMRQAILRLPKELNKGKRIQILARDLVIDETGLTGSFAAENLLDLEHGTIGGWAYSLDRAQINLISGSLSRGEIAGKISLPIMKEGKSISYAAMIDYKGDFLFSASMPDQIKVPMFKSEMTIEPSSTFTIKETNDNITVTALLNGSITISAPLGKTSENDTTDFDKQKKGLTLSGLRFEQMRISTESPGFRPGLWAVDEIGIKTGGVNGFALSLSDIEVKENVNGDAGIGFRGRINFSGNRYCAAASLTLWGEKKTGSDNRSRYKYKSTQVNDIFLKVEDEAISIEGYFAIYKDDPKYGDGFAAKVKAKFLIIALSATAVFGEVDDYKYFYVDALADLSESPITMSAVAFYGFGGGAYSHMRQIPLTDNPMAATQASGSNAVINYEPDKSTAFGFKATVVLGTSGNSSLFNARVTFEMSFNEHGGVKNVMFYGAGYFLSQLDVLNETKSGPIYGTAYIGYDVDNRIFHSSLKIYINIAGIIQGINPGNLAGEACIHVEPHDWYIYIGRPATRVGVKINILGISIENGSYFMMGTKIDEMPPPPDKVLEILGTKVANRPGGEMSLKGFCFGTSFAISTGELSLLIFYARFDMGMGFDVILADRSDFVCAHNGKKPGINGWYAEGQVYAYIEGDIGIRINLFVKKIKMSILQLGVATLLEAKLPNPFWMRGQVGGYYRILGGKIKGKCKFQFELGKLCEFQAVVEENPADAVAGLTVISDITPEDGREGIDVFNAPQAVFNYQINKPFSISDNATSPESYKVILDYFKVTAGDQTLVGTFDWNSNGDVLVFNPRDILPGKTRINLEARIHFEELKGNVWKAIQDSGQTVTETKISSFVTGEAPQYIPENNILYCYPMSKMMNLYKNEYTSGYIQLRMGQEYLFSGGTEWKYYARFTPIGGGTPLYMNVSYQPAEKLVTYSLPGSLTNNTNYKFELVSIPSGATEAIDKNIVQVTTATENESGEIQVTENKAADELTIPGEKIIYENYLRTSLYNTFTEKVQSLSLNQGYTWPIAQGIYEVGSQVSGAEPFDNYELIGSEALVNFVADESGRWLKDYATPILYADYPINGNIRISWRNTNEFGIVPLKAVSFKITSSGPTILSMEDISAGVSGASGFKGVLIYKLNILAVYDWDDIIAGAFRAPVYNDRIKKILDNPCPAILFNTTYPVKATYRLPGLNKVTHSAILNISVI
jgi:hypothetical protein